MEITATELKLNLGKYLEAANDEEIIITKNGKPIARLTGVRTFKYDLSELDQLKEQMIAGRILAEAPTPVYGTASTPADTTNEGEAAALAGWYLTHNGEPVAQLAPILKQKKKRRLGFIDCGPVSEETDAALFESDFTGEDYERWLNEEL